MFEIPGQIEKYLATLSKAYAMKNLVEIASVIVNGRPKLEEGVEQYYDFGRDSYGHVLRLTLPEPLYLQIFDRRNTLGDQIKGDLNELIKVRDEYIHTVSFEMDFEVDSDWRRESGLLLTGEKLVTPQQQSRIWDDNGFRLFISHKSSSKVTANKIKEEVRPFGISAFVAHEDVEPTREWQNEIENALATMDAFVALLTDDFHDSFWTDQEVGFAFGRGVPIIAIKSGLDPYGFIGKFQGLKFNKITISLDLVKILMREPKMLDEYISAIEASSSWISANSISGPLGSIQNINDRQVERLVNAFNTNIEITGAFGFNGTKPLEYGGGLPEHLTRLTGKKYALTSSGELATQA